MRNFRIPQVFTLIPQTVCLRIVYAEFERLHIAVEPIAYSTITFINSQCKYRLIF